MTSNQLAALHRANPTADVDACWYEAAHEQVAALAGETDLPVDTVAGIVAAMSPQNAWDTSTGRTPNLDTARSLIGGRAPHTAVQVGKGRAILRGVHPLDV